jgi:hypothetical protein
MKKTIITLGVLLLTTPLLAEEPPMPAQTLLRNVNRIRAGIEQEEDKDAERLKNAAGQAAVWREPGASLGDLRGRVADNMKNIREPFRCLDVDIEKNSGPVVLVCGGNSGTAAAIETNRVNSDNKFFATTPAAALGKMP